MRIGFAVILSFFSISCNTDVAAHTSGNVELRIVEKNYSAANNLYRIIVQLRNDTGIPAYYPTYKNQLIYSFSRRLNADTAYTGYLINTKSYDMTYPSTDSLNRYASIKTLSPFKSIEDTLEFPGGFYKISTTCELDSEFYKYIGLSLNVSCRFELK